MSEQSDFEVEISVTRSAGEDRAVLVLIDTSFEPFAPGDDDLGLRVLLNDNEIYVGKPYDLGAHHDASSVNLIVRSNDIAYTGDDTRKERHHDDTRL